LILEISVVNAQPVHVFTYRSQPRSHSAATQSWQPALHCVRRRAGAQLADRISTLERRTATISCRGHEWGGWNALAAASRPHIRRATFDLIGLPPTPAEVDAFVSDKSPNLFAKLFDRLLASPPKVSLHSQSGRSQ